MIGGILGVWCLVSGNDGSPFTYEVIALLYCHRFVDVDGETVQQDIHPSVTHSSRRHRRVHEAQLINHDCAVGFSLRLRVFELLDLTERHNVCSILGCHDDNALSIGKCDS